MNVQIYEFLLYHKETGKNYGIISKKLIFAWSDLRGI